MQAFVGRRLLVRLGVGGSLTALELAAFGWLAGFALSTIALLPLAAAGALGPSTVVALFAVFAAASWPSVRGLYRAASEALASVQPSARTVALAVAGIVVASIWIWPLVVQTLLPNSDWDSALYQLPLAERYVDGALFRRDPYFPAYSFPGAVNLLYAALLAVGLEAAIVPLDFWVAVMTIAVTAGLAVRFGTESTARWGVVVLASVPLFWQVGVDPRIDGFLALCVTLAFYGLYLLVCHRDDDSFLLTALALGGALGCKYTAVFYAGGVSAVALLVLAHEKLRATRDGGAKLARIAGLYALILLVPNGTWYAANEVIHGDPLFPMIRGFYVLTDDGERRYLPSEKEPLAAALLESPAMQRALDELPDAPTVQPPSTLFDVARVLVTPDAYAVKPNHGVGPLPFLSLLLPIVLALAWRPRPWRTDARSRFATLVVWACAWGSYALLGSQTNLLRYVLPAIPTLAALAGLVIASIPFRWVRAVVGAFAALLLVVSHVAEVARLDLLQARDGVALPADGLTGWKRGPRTRWLERVGYNFTPAMAFATAQINAFVADGRMRRDDVVLMVGEGKGRLLACDYLPDGSWFMHRFAAELENASYDGDLLAKRFADHGVTHVLYNHGYFDDWVLPTTRTDRSRIAFARVHLERFLAEHGRTTFRGPGIDLVELRAPARSDAGAAPR